MQVLGNVNEDLTSEVSISHKHTLWAVNDVKGKTPCKDPRGVFPASLGAFHLERPLKSCKLKFEESFQVDCPHRSPGGLAKSSFS